MTEPTPTSGVKPLTEAEQKTLDDLTARKVAAEADQRETERKAKLASYESVEALLKLVRTDKISAAFDAVLADNAVDFDTKKFIMNVSESLRYNLGEIESRIAVLKTPAPTT